ncbi:GAF domain-containing protein [Sporosarcina sp. NCCP-2222]|uniref:GAF domain-containing protein n=1 Tax=Sporosarcina sp. NCCP-2222 TaxID=2935073 RepID=UPI00207E540F|nr:GAF domain-containing protein [Sporosarcina sp. NCCP-2222]GKV56068.1 GAF domain-containing protein [Sporosarcina sp. NCCP-2222]
MKEELFNVQREIEKIQNEFDFDYVGVAFVQSADRRFELRWKYVTGNQSDRHQRLALQSGKGIAGLVFKTGKPMFISNADEELGGEDLYNYPIVVAEGLKSFGAIPLYKYNRVRGVLLAGYRTDGRLKAEVFREFQEWMGPQFGPFYSKEMVCE